MLKPIGIIAIVLVSAIVLGCVDSTDNLPEPKKLSDSDKNNYPYIFVRDLIKSPDSYLNKYIYLRGEISWIKEDGDITSLIIDVPNPSSSYIEGVGYLDTEPVSVYYKGKLPGMYKGTEVIIYGIVKGADTIKYTSTGSEKEVPKIYAIQIS